MTPQPCQNLFEQTASADGLGAVPVVGTAGQMARYMPWVMTRPHCAGHSRVAVDLRGRLLLYPRHDLGLGPKPETGQSCGRGKAASINPIIEGSPSADNRLLAQGPRIEKVHCGGVLQTRVAPQRGANHRRTAQLLAGGFAAPSQAAFRSI